MEPRGCNRWQAVANPKARRSAETSETVAVGCDQLPIGAHGKEGVDRSSPSEDSAKAPEIGTFFSDCFARSTTRNLAQRAQVAIAIYDSHRPGGWSAVYMTAVAEGLEDVDDP